METSSEAKPKVGFHEHPTISANQLAEYVLTSPAKRQGIIRNAKYPPTMLVIRYRAAKEAICRFLADGTRSKQKLYEAEATLREKENDETLTAFQRDEARLCVEALTSFYAALNQPELVKMRFSKPTSKPPALMIGKVAVRVSVNLFSHLTVKGSERIGGLVLQTSKTVSATSIRSEHGRNVATLIYLLMNEHFTHLGEPDKKLCLAVDVFSGSVSVTPASYKRKINDFQAACAEITVLWGVVTPPPSYKSSTSPVDDVI